MGIFDKLRGEFIDIIEWLDSSNDTMLYRFERYNNEIKYGAKLIVRESQVAVFVNEGQIADVFAPGTYTLETKNMPILSTLQGWKYGFESPFKAEVYFVNTKNFTDLKWGTKNPIMLRDPEFGPLRVRAYGTYVFRVSDPAKLVREITGTDGHFTTGEISEQLRDILVSRFAGAISNSGIPVLDMAANYEQLSKVLLEKIQPEFENYGITLTKLLVENISLPPEVEEVLDKRTSMGIVGNLQNYTQFQAATAMTDAAQNPGGLAAGGIGMGLGMAMAGQMSGAMAAQAQAPQSAAAPPPLPQAPTYYLARGNQQTGPFDMAALQQQALAGQLTRDMLVWTAGMAQWSPAGDVPALASLFAQVPPPLPPG